MLSLNKSYKKRKVSLTIHCKYKYFDSTVQRAEDRRQKFYFCRLPFAVNVKLNLSNISKNTPRICVKAYCIPCGPSCLYFHFLCKVNIAEQVTMSKREIALFLDFCLYFLNLAAGNDAHSKADRTGGG